MPSFREFLLVALPADVTERVSAVCASQPWQIDHAGDFSSASELFDTYDYKVIMVGVNQSAQGLAILEWLKSRRVFSVLGVCGAEADSNQTTVALQLEASIFLSVELSHQPKVLLSCLKEALNRFDQNYAAVVDCKNDSALPKPVAWVGADPQMRFLLERARHEALTQTPVLLYGPRGSVQQDLASVIEQTAHRIGKKILRIADVESLDIVKQQCLVDFCCGRGWRADGQVTWPSIKFVASTQVDLAARVHAGTFCENLFLLLQQNQLLIPALADRRHDIPLVATYFLQAIPSHLRQAHRFDEDALAVLQSYNWPGDVAELQSVVCDVAARVTSQVIQAKDLAPQILENGFYAMVGAQHAAPLRDYNEAKKMALNKFNKEYISNLLTQTHNNFTVAAEVAGIDRSNFKKIVKRYYKDE